jgi:hypothetical protein
MVHCPVGLAPTLLTMTVYPSALSWLTVCSTLDGPDGTATAVAVDVIAATDRAVAVRAMVVSLFIMPFWRLVLISMLDRHARAAVLVTFTSRAGRSPARPVLESRSDSVEFIAGLVGVGV